MSENDFRLEIQRYEVQALITIFNELYQDLYETIHTDYEIEFKAKFEDDGIDEEEEILSIKNEDIYESLIEIISLLYRNWHYVFNFDKDDIYRVLNCIQLAKNERIKKAKVLRNSEEFKILRQNYTNSR